MNFRSKWATFGLFSVAALMMAGTAWAQPGRGGGGGFGRGGGGGDPSMGLIFREEIQEELDILGDQKEQLDEAMEDFRNQMRERFMSLRELPEDERREAFGNIREEMAAQQKEFMSMIENDILLPVQAERLKQLALQSQMRNGIPESMYEKYGITDDQVEAMREKAEEAQKTFNEKVAKLRAQMQEEVLSVLEPDQVAAIKKDMGDAYNFGDRGRGGFGQQRGGRDQGGRDQGGRGGRDQGGRDRGGRGGRPGADGGTDF